MASTGVVTASRVRERGAGAAGSRGAGRTSAEQREAGVLSLPLGLPTDPMAAAKILYAEDRRELTEALAELSRRSDPDLQARAALAIGRVGLPAGVPRLLELIRHEAPQVRALAAFGLGLIETDLGEPLQELSERQIVDGLVPLLQDPSATVAAQAARSLGLQGSALAREALAAVLDGGDENDPELVAEAAGVWWRLPDAAPERLVALLGSRETAVRRAAVHALRRIGDPNALPALLPLLDDEDAEVRAAAAGSLRQAPASVAEVHAVRLLQDRDWRVVAEGLVWLADAWERLADRSDASEAAVAAVIRAGLGRVPHARRLASAALAKVAASWPVALDQLLQTAADSDSAVRSAALDALASTGAEGARRGWELARRRYGLDGPPPTEESSEPERLGELATSGLESAAMVRLMAAAAAGGEALEARAWLEYLAEHGPLPARAEVLRQWQLLEPQYVAGMARRVLAGGSPELRGVSAGVIAALHGVGRLPPPAMDKPEWSRLFWQAQQDLESDGNIVPRIQILEGLLSLDRELLQTRAAVLFEASRRPIRVWALRHLAAPTRDVPVAELFHAVAAPFDSGRRLEDYERLVARLAALEARPPTLRFETPRGDFDLVLEASWAPLTVYAYLRLVEQGFFDGSSFHRVVADFAIQAGDPTAVGPGGASLTLRNEETPIAYETGTVGLALAGRDTGGSQFFVVHSAQPQLTGVYPVLGRVVGRGQRVVDRIQPGDAMRAGVVRLSSAR